MSDFYSLKVASVKQLTPNSVTLSFDIPEDLKPAFRFAAGQYITIKKMLNGKEIRRAYSISSAPSSGKLTIGIKKVSNGTFSKYANESISTGDTLEVMKPEGRFMFETSDTPKTIAAFAAGSGITPIMSIAQTVLESNKANRFVLVYGNQNPEEAMYRAEILQLQEKYAERFFVQWIYSRSNEEGALFGRIDKGVVNLILKNRFKEFLFDRFYLCGPEAMINTVSESLKNNGIKEDNILFELFTLSNTNDNPVESPKGQTKIMVLLDDEEHEFMMDQKDFLLDAVLNHDIDAPYSCQGGICSSCVARVVEGEVEMVKNQILTNGEVTDGLVLTCQSRVKSSTLRIDYDDV